MLRIRLFSGRTSRQPARIVAFSVLLLAMAVFVRPAPAAGDVDLDDVDDAFDNCIGTFNPDQHDGDADTFGDACDPDDDNDGTPDNSDPNDDGSPGDNDPDGADNCQT